MAKLRLFCLASCKYLHYFVCFVTFCIFLTTIGNFQLFLSKQTLNSFDPDSSVLSRFIWDVVLLLAFLAQHSLMASPHFKSAMRQYLGISVTERLVYTLASCVALFSLVLYWQSIPECYLWYIYTPPRPLVWCIFFLLHVVCWLTLGLEAALMDLTEMVGIRQVLNYHGNQPEPFASKSKQLVEIYGSMRHPGPVLVSAILWIHPMMTLDRLLLACVVLTYLVYRHSLRQLQIKFAETYFVYTDERKETSVRSKFVSADE